MPIIPLVFAFVAGTCVGAYAHAKLTRKSGHERQNPRKRTSCPEPKVSVHPFDVSDDTIRPEPGLGAGGARPEESPPPAVEPAPESKEPVAGPELPAPETPEEGSEIMSENADGDRPAAEAGDGMLTEEEDLSDLSLDRPVETPEEKLLKDVAAVAGFTVEGPGAAYVKQATDHFLEDYAISRGKRGNLLDLLKGLGKVAMDFEDQAESNVSVRDTLQRANETLCDVMRHAGAQDMVLSESFSYLRHIPVRVSGLVKEGRPLVRFLTPGLCYEGRILKRARVEVVEE